MWALSLVVGVLVPLAGQLVAFLVARPSRVGGERFLMWVPVAGSLLLASQRAIPRARRVSAIALGAVASYLAVSLLVLIGLFARGEVVATRPVVKAVVPGAPAAGLLEVGDRIERAGGVPLEPGRPNLAQQIDRLQGRPVPLDVVRGGEARVVEVTPVRDERGAHRIGIELTYVDERARPPLARAVGTALAEPTRRIGIIASALRQIASGTEEADFMGPVGIQDAFQRSEGDPTFDLMLLFAIYGLVFALPLALALTVVALVTRDKVAA